MRRVLIAALLAVVGCLTTIEIAYADDCTPAMCAALNPACWLAYEKIMVHKGQDIASEGACKEMATDGRAFGAWLKVQDLDTRTAICACAAAYWSLQGLAQGLPDWD